MPNGRELINEMDYRERIKAMGERELSEFTAMQIYEACLIQKQHDKRITSLERRDRRSFGYTGGIGGVIGAALAVLVEFLFRR